MTLFFEYLEHGWALTPIRNGSKQPLLRSWTRPENAICDPENAHKFNGAAGLLLAHCDPPIMTLDIDDFHGAEAWLNERGVDLVHLLQAGDAVQIDSGRPNRAKLLYHMDRPRFTHKVIQEGKTVLEFRCADRNGGSVQDVLPPSMHPETGEPYMWKGDWRFVPEVPASLLGVWDDLISPSHLIQRSKVAVDLPACTATELRQTLSRLDPDPEDQWWRVLAICATTGLPEAKEIARQWSKGSTKYIDAEFDQKWEHAMSRSDRADNLSYKSLAWMTRKANSKPETANADEPILQVNEDFAWVRHGGGNPVMEILRQVKPHEVQVAFMSKANFLTTFKNKPKVASEGKLIELGSYWLGHSARREYRSVVFDPTASPGADVGDRFNLFRGWAVEPIAGDCDRFLDFVFKMVCNRDEALYEWLMKWCAHIFQRPGDKPGTAPVFQGGQGVGKNTFMDTIGALLGRHYVEIDSLERLFGRFNFGTADKLLVVANEALWGGDKRMLGQLKSFVTEPSQTFEQKGVDSITMPSYTRLMLASNERHPVHIDADDRRFVFFKVNPEHARDEVYFKAIRKWRDDGGLASLLHHLLDMDLTDYSPRVRPSSGFSQSVAELSMSHEQAFWKTVLNDGEVRVRQQLIHGQWMMVVVTPEDRSWSEGIIKDQVYAAYVEQIRPQRGNAVNQQVFFDTLYQMLQLSPDETRNMSRGQIRVDKNTRVRVLKLMSLSELRERYAKATGHPQDWEPTGLSREADWDKAEIPF